MHKHPGDRPVYRATGILGGFAGFLLFPVLAWAISRFVLTERPPGELGPVETERWKRLTEVRQVEGEQVSTAGWIDQAANKVRIPVQAATELVLPELQSKAPKASTMLVPGRPVPAPKAGETSPSAKPGEASPAPKPGEASPAPKPGETSPGAKPSGASPGGMPPGQTQAPAPAGSEPQGAPARGPALDAAGNVGNRGK